MHVREADSPPSGRVPGHDERNSWSVAKRLSAVTLRPKQQENIALPKAVWLYKEFSGFRT